MKIKIGSNRSDQRELIPNPDGVQPVEYCQVCGRSNDLFWNGRYMLCTECQKDAAIARKLKVKLVDEGIPLDEFLSRLRHRLIIYKWASWEEFYGGVVAHNPSVEPNLTSNSVSNHGSGQTIRIGTRLYKV